MITSIFNKSRPINYVLVAIFVFIYFLSLNLQFLVSDISYALIGIARFLIVLFMIFLLDFIISKNNLSKNNSYAILTFGLLVGVFPEIFKHSNLLLANLFVLFALRRIISLHSNVSLKKKLFDAGFWIMIATLFYFWSILFFSIVIVALIYHSQNDIKNTIIPFIGIAVVLIILLVYNIIFHDVFIRYTNFQPFASLDFTAYNSKENIVRLTVFFTTLLWILIYFFRVLPDKNNKLKPSYFLIAWSSIIAVLITVIAPLKNGSEFLFVFAPFSIIMANYIEVISEKWFKEIFIILLIITPIINLLL
ncbi:DUF6427 family protein [uncultured Winogradskyella sp.]|uniref:DUF6427 family protein n=1 Tax=uncultured Winogradskyella sp. TaxID=395353 RepID=UPI00262D6463|nr:DUF6427 family protein [uncultured Winogradskyella sp.]